MERVKFERKWVNLTAAPVNYSNMPQSFRESTIPIIMIITIIVNYSNNNYNNNNSKLFQ